MHAVKNRFLLRLKNEGCCISRCATRRSSSRAISIVIVAALTIERSSLPALAWLWKNRAPDHGKTTRHPEPPPQSLRPRARRMVSLKIAIPGTRGVPPRYGGFETFAAELSTRLVARGHEVAVYCREQRRDRRLVERRRSHRPPRAPPQVLRDRQPHASLRARCDAARLRRRPPLQRRERVRPPAAARGAHSGGHQRRRHRAPSPQVERRSAARSTRSASRSRSASPTASSPTRTSSPTTTASATASSRS